MKLEERLNAIIAEKESEIDTLQEKIQKLEALEEANYWVWTRHVAFEEDEFFRKMPYPRLEMRFEKTSEDWYRVRWTYGIVMKHYADTLNSTLIFIPLSQTTSNGGNRTFESWLENGMIQRPFRDRVHIMSDAKQLNLPAYIICREKGIIEGLTV